MQIEAGTEVLTAIDTGNGRPDRGQSTDEILLLRKDTNGLVSYVSTDLARRLGTDPQNLKGRPRSELAHSDLPGWLQDRMERDLREGRPWAGPVKLLGARDSGHWFYAEIQALTEEAGGGAVERYSDLSEVEREDARALFAMNSDPLASLREQARRRIGRLTTIRGRMRIVLFLGIAYLLFAAAFIGLSYVAIRYYTHESNRLVQKIHDLDSHYNDHIRRWMTILNPATKSSQLAALEKEIQEADARVQEEQSALREDLQSTGIGAEDLKLVAELEQEYGALSSAVAQSMKDRRENDNIKSVAESGMQYRITGAMQRARAGLAAFQHRQAEVQAAAAEIEGMVNEQDVSLRSAISPAGAIPDAGREAARNTAISAAIGKGGEMRFRLRGLRAATGENPLELAGALDDAGRQFHDLMALFSNTLGGNQSMDTTGDAEGSYEKRLGRRTERLKGIVEEHLRGRIQLAEIIHIIGIIGTLGIGLLILIGFPSFISGTFLRPLEQLQQVAEKLADGDLSARLETKGFDEVSRVFDAMRTMGIRLRGLVAQIQDSSRSSAKSSARLSDHASSLSASAQEQAVATEQSSAAVEQLTSAADLVERTIREQAEELGRNKQVTEMLSAEAEAMRQNMVDLKALARESAAQASSGESTINEAAEAMIVIRSQSDRISEIVTMIRDISDRTHLLSLNASIEAARAGDEGRGFAVVATEISRLADRTAESVKEIDRLIRMTGDAVRRGSDQFTMAATNFKDIIVRVGRIDAASDHLLHVVEEQAVKAGEIGTSAAHVASLAANVDQAAREQKKAMSEVNTNIQGISQRSQSVGEAALDLSTLVRELAAQAEILRSLIERFRMQ